MKQIILTLLSFFIIEVGSAQDLLKAELKPVVTEGILIYKIATANKLGSKLFPLKYSGKEKAAGYVSYSDADQFKTIVYSGGEKPKALGSFTFNEKLEESKAVFDPSTRELSGEEAELMRLQNAAFKESSDVSSYQVPSNAKLTPVVIRSNDERKVFLITESTSVGTVFFGNDYILNFDAKYNLADKQPLHKNMSVVNYDPEAGSANDKESSHTMVAAKSDLVTSTDVAVLLLCESATKWTHHSFISENYI